MASVEVDTLRRGFYADVSDPVFLAGQSPKKTRGKESSKHYGVRLRPDHCKWVAEIRVPKNVDKKVWLGTFDSEEGAARAVDLARNLLKCKQKRPANFPCNSLSAYSEKIPTNLNLDNLQDDSMFKEIILFVKRKAQEYAASFVPNKIAYISISTDQILAPVESFEPSSEEEKLLKLPEYDHLKAVKADFTKFYTVCPAEEPDGHEWHKIVLENVVQEFNDGSSAMDESFAEVTADSPCLETNSKFDGKKRKSIDDDGLVTKIAPLIKQQIEDALSSTLLPLVSVLRSREEDEQKHRETLLALEEEKLALKREKLLFKRRRVALSQPDLRSSYSPRWGYKKQGHGLRLKTSALR
ncbi:hypothetical protein KC19_1G063700 [Ceratodon purpureus]|uniref:AP2/ERF domain-containing protein n=1 Tax=Ceratodon purpureus TaxID=3225 RepID=A0A8T0J4M9_CERPU|nr:hypothetical protein KC19_1G063700 [Ceratodon purpureus]